MSIYQDAEDYRRELERLEAERHSETPAFNEDFMVPRKPTVFIRTPKAEACAFFEAIFDSSRYAASVSDFTLEQISPNSWSVIYDPDGACPEEVGCLTTPCKDCPQGNLSFDDWFGENFNV